MLSRRKFLTLLGNGAAWSAASRLARAAPGLDPRAAQLRADLLAVLEGREIGFDLRRIDPDGFEYFRVQHNADELYPVASCFKAFLGLYYFWNTPRAEWRTELGSTLHSVVVYSNNTLTGTLLEDISARLDIYGNAIEKFNDFLLYRLGLRNGLFAWNWEGTITENLIDNRFAPSDERYVEIRGLRYAMDNLITAREMADGYAFLIRPFTLIGMDSAPQAAAAAAAALDLLAIPAGEYQSPIERVFADGYTGKDGVLPADQSAVGRVINDAGIVPVGDGLYIVSYLCAGEGEFLGLELLRQIAALLEAYEADRVS
jgi:hypothetical protein